MQSYPLLPLVLTKQCIQFLLTFEPATLLLFSSIAPALGALGSNWLLEKRGNPPIVFPIALISLWPCAHSLLTCPCLCLASAKLQVAPAALPVAHTSHAVTPCKKTGPSAGGRPQNIYSAKKARKDGATATAAYAVLQSSLPMLELLMYC